MEQFNANKPLPPTPTSYKWLIVALIIGIIVLIGGVTTAIVYSKKDSND